MLRGKRPIEKFLIISIATAFISLFILLSGVLFDSFKSSNKTDAPEISPTTLVTPSPTSQWKQFISEKYEFSLSYPRLLFPQENEKSANYLYFVAFLENSFSEENMKGIAIGITDRSLQEEKTLVVDLLANENISVLTKETQLENLEGYKLEYIPTEEDGEPRDIFIIKGENFVYSLSTHPTQSQELLSSFELLNTKPTTNTTPETACGGFGGIPCPQGFVCAVDKNNPDEAGTCVIEQKR